MTAGLADLDLDGSGSIANAAALTVLGITPQERARLAQLYTPGETFWRVPIKHFTPWDFNWPYGPPPDAISPPGKNPNKPVLDNPNNQCGSIIGCEDQTLGESLPVAGTPWRLHYRSDRTPGREDAYTLTIPLSGEPVPKSLSAIRVEVNIAGHLYEAAFPPGNNLSHVMRWDGRDGYGRSLQGTQPAVVKVHYDYLPYYYAVYREFVNSFDQASAAGFVVSLGPEASA
jgi:hypothetical protein